MPSHLQKAVAEIRLGHFESALAHAESAIRLGQQGIKPYLCAALAAARLHGDERALEWVERGLLLDPDDCLLLAARANLLRGLHRTEAALENSRRWARLEPRNAEAHLCCARVYRESGLYEPAIAAYTAAAECTLRPAAVLTDLSILLFELGRSDDAWRMLDRALAADPRCAAAWYTRSEAKRFTQADPDIDVMRRHLQARAAEANALHENILLHYALAKAYVDLEDYSQALSHLRSGSTLKRSTCNYDPALDERFMAEMARVLTAASIERLSGAGIATTSPIFIVGMPRSGTSLLEQLLASHPSVFGGGESARMQSLVAEFGADYPAALSTLSQRQISALAARYLGMLPTHATIHITDKTPYNFLHLGLIHAMFPLARIIHCRRDPVDTCVSVYSTWFAQGNEFSYDIRELARYYRAYAHLMEHWRNVIPVGLILEVEYEKLVRDFPSEARKVVEFCGLSWTDACLAFHETKRAVQTASKHQVRKPLYTSSVGRARRFPGLWEQLHEHLNSETLPQPRGSAPGSEPGEYL
jgi:tetratricopeptide (TPR) repeat protein